MSSVKLHSLNQLLETCSGGLPEIFFRNVVTNSEKVRSGDLFVALRGSRTDGGLYIPQAVGRGAVAVLRGTECSDRKVGCEVWNVDGNCVPVFEIYRLERRLSALAGNLYSHPSDDLCLVGITGTNGKTTVGHLLAQWVSAVGVPAGIIGTLGGGPLGTMTCFGETTRPPVENQRMLADLLTRGVRFVTMEVSSHGLLQHRVDGLHFTAVVFTGLGHDHLDYHLDLSRYESAKLRLFTELMSDHQVINVSDGTGFRWARDLPAAMIVSLHSRVIPAGWRGDWLCLDQACCHQQGISICFRSSLGNGRFDTRLMGRFNVINVLLSLATLLRLGYSPEELCHSAGALEPIRGRMELISAPGRPKMVVDYAHNPEALQSALVSSRVHCRRALWCVFGCGGDRDREKRGSMGAVAERCADRVVITGDNPRGETVEEIVEDIKAGMHVPELAQVISDREEAIRWAVRQSSAEDVILVAGKGHEVDQIIGRRSVHHSDREVVLDILGMECDDETSSQ